MICNVMNADNERIAEGGLAAASTAHSDRVGMRPVQQRRCALNQHFSSLSLSDTYFPSLLLMKLMHQKHAAMGFIISINISFMSARRTSVNGFL